MANRDTQLVLSLVLTLVLGAGYTLLAFIAVLSFWKGGHVVWVEAIIATAIPLLVLGLIWLLTRLRAPSIWKGTAIGMIFVVLLCGVCNGSAVAISMSK